MLWQVRLNIIDSRTVKGDSWTSLNCGRKYEGQLTVFAKLNQLPAEAMYNKHVLIRCCGNVAVIVSSVCQISQVHDCITCHVKFKVEIMAALE